MEDENQRRSRRIWGLDHESPPAPEYIPVEPHLVEETTHYETEDIPQGEEHLEGHIEIISEGPLSPFNPPLANMNVPALVDIITPLCRRTLPLIEEVSTDLVNVMPFTESVSPHPA